MVAVYSVSGIPRCSLSIAISRSSKSEILSWLGLSNMNVRESESSSVFSVIMSSLPEHFRIFAIDSNLIPRARVRSAHAGLNSLREHEPLWVAQLTATIVLEAILSHKKCHQRHMAVVHSLQRDPRAAAIEVGLGDKVLHPVQDLSQQGALDEAGFKHRGKKREKRKEWG